MTKIKILIEGYAKEIENGWIASSTSCLIFSDNKKIITDPGCNRQKLFEALKKEKITPSDIDYVFLSHCHPDHILLAGIFENAKYVTFDSNLIYDKDLLLPFQNDVLGKDIEIIETPGHVLEHLSLVVNTEIGKIVVAGDAIWWTDDQEQIFDLNQNDSSQAKGMNMDQLVESRKAILAVADYIIPGHGKMFKVKR